MKISDKRLKEIVREVTLKRLDLNERVRQSSYLQFGSVHAFQSLLGMELVRDTGPPEAVNEWNNEILGPQTERLWRLWVDANYDPNHEKLKKLYLIPQLQKILEDRDVVDVRPPISPQVQANWEHAAWQLGYEPPKTFGSQLGVDDAIAFIRDINDADGYGGFSRTTLNEMIRAEEEEEEERAVTRRPRPSGRIDRPGQQVVRDTDFTEPDLPVGASEAERQEQAKENERFARQRSAVMASDTPAFDTVGTKYFTGWAGHTDPSLAYQMWIDSRSGSIHPIFTDSGQFKFMAEAMKDSLDVLDITSIGVSDKNLRDVLRALVFVAGSPRSGGVIPTELGGDQRIAHQRGGVIIDDEVWDAPYYLAAAYYDQEGDTLGERVESEWSPTDVLAPGRPASTKKALKGAMEKIFGPKWMTAGRGGVSARGQGRVSPSAGRIPSEYRWDPGPVEELVSEGAIQVNEVRQVTSHANLSQAIRKALQESFGVKRIEGLHGPAEPAPTPSISDEPELPSAGEDIRRTRIEVATTFPLGERSTWIKQIQKAIGAPQTGEWDLTSESHWDAYVEANMNANADLKGSVKRNWAAAAAVLDNQGFAGWPPTPMGAYHMLKNPQLFPDTFRMVG